MFGANQGTYTLSLNDKGKASSIVSPAVPSNIGNARVQVGTIVASGIFSPLASSDARKLDGGTLFDIALAPNNQLHGVGPKVGSGNILYRIDPSVATLDRVSEVGALKNSQGGTINDNLKALEFTPDNKLYALGSQQKVTQLITITLASMSFRIRADRSL